MSTLRYMKTHRFLIAAIVFLLSNSAVKAEPCGEWTVALNPVYNGNEYRPTLISAFSPDSAVDGVVGAGGLVQTTWDGFAWTPGSPQSLNVTSPASINAVAGSGPGDLWITGGYFVNNLNSWPYLAHFDGQAWDVVEGSLIDIPNPQAGDPIRSGGGDHLAVITPNDIWAVGLGEAPNAGSGGASSSPIAMHWDGSSFEEFEPQIQPVFNSLNRVEGVAAAASDAVWLVGSGRNLGTNDTRVHLFTYRFDGSTWTPQTNWTPLPGPASLSEKLNDVVAFAHDDAWAFGEKLILMGSTTKTLPLYLHWDGDSWNEVAGPDIGLITSAAASGSNDIWVSNAFGEFGGRLAHWDGDSWFEIESAPLQGATHIGLTNLAASPMGDVWAVGYWGIYNGAGGWTVYEDILEQFVPGCVGIGDLDGNGILELADVVLFTSVLTGANADPELSITCDINDDGETNGADIAPFVSAFVQ